LSNGCTQRGRAGGDHTDRKLRQHHRISVVQRQFFDLFRRDRLSGRGVCRVQQRRLGAHVDDFGEIADVEHKIDDGMIAGGEMEAGARERLESGQHRVNLVVARRQERHHEAAGIVGGRLALRSRSRFHDGDGDARNRPAARILDGAGDGGAELLRARGARREQ
jgi:hypothetical protein